jgi:hypothetical protein
VDLCAHSPLRLRAVALAGTTSLLLQSDVSVEGAECIPATYEFNLIETPAAGSSGPVRHCQRVAQNAASLLLYARARAGWSSPRRILKDVVCRMTDVFGAGYTGNQLTGCDVCAIE